MATDQRCSGTVTAWSHCPWTHHTHSHTPFLPPHLLLIPHPHSPSSHSCFRLHFPSPLLSPRPVLTLLLLHLNPPFSHPLPPHSPPPSSWLPPLPLLSTFSWAIVRVMLAMRCAVSPSPLTPPLPHLLPTPIPPPSTAPTLPAVAPWPSLPAFNAFSAPADRPTTSSPSTAHPELHP